MDSPADPIDDLLWPFVCPESLQRLHLVADDELATVDGERRFYREDGIWRFLSEEREALLAQFMQEYAIVRQGEARGSQEASYFTSLPYEDLSGRFSAEWLIRSRSYETLLNAILTKLIPGSKILDIGAGNGWLSGRLSKMGFAVAAIDVQVDALDGLGAHRHYVPSFTAIQADFDQLPLDKASADLVIYNAAFHYSPNYRVTLAEALRVAKPNAQLVIVDTPVYQRKKDGEQMVAEREAQFLDEYGFKSNAIASENFLTYGRLKQLEQQLMLKWGFYDPKFPFTWRWQRRFSTLRSGREAAQFPVIVATRQ